MRVPFANRAQGGTEEDEAMASVNKAILIGNLGKDPELRETQSGKSVASFPIATNEKWTDQSGEKHEKTEWHNIVAWGRTAEVCCEYLSKGSAVYIEGRLQTRKWQDKDGNDRYTTEIVADRMQFIGGKGAGGQDHEVPPPADDDSIPF